MRNPRARWTLPAVVDPPNTVCFEIHVPDEEMHIAAFLGAIFSLSTPYSWQNDDAHTALRVGRVWRKIFLALQKNNCTKCPPPAGGGGCEDCMGCCLRINDSGVLQQLECGVWIDIPGQPPGGLLGGGQSGAGQPQPQPGGACLQYNGVLPGNGQWLLPTVVSTGDTLNLSGLQGVFFDDASHAWYCPDGSAFFAGFCTGVHDLGAGNFMPAVFTGRLIAQIGATYYDIQPGPFTVPGGHANDQVTLLQNTSDLVHGGGSVSFFIEVCNNAAETWSVDFDLAAAPGPFITIFDPSSVQFMDWIPGTGWQSHGNGPFGGLYYRVVSLHFLMLHAGVIKTMEVNYNDGTAVDSCDNGGISIGATNLFILNCPVTKGANDISYALFNQAYSIGDDLVFGFDGSKNNPMPTGDITLQRVRMTGTGPNPFVA